MYSAKGLGELTLRRHPETLLRHCYSDTGTVVAAHMVRNLIRQVGLRKMKDVLYFDKEMSYSPIYHGEALN